MRRIHVMAAVIRRADGSILIAKRPDAAHQGGLWEFPGGKLEEGEPRLDGLARELQEELGIHITNARPLIDIRHDYPDKSIRLDVWSVSAFSGEAHGAEGQQVRWVAPQDLGQYAFPAANKPIVLAATLPQRYLITPDNYDADQLITGLGVASGLGVRMVQLRQTELSQTDYANLATTLMAKTGEAVMWILKGEQPPLKGSGWHVTSAQLRELHAVGWCKGKRFATGPSLLQSADELERRPECEETWDGLLAASCHNAEELQMANDIGADFVTLSPVLPTQSHPGAAHLGWDRAAELAAMANMPVYLLGGLSLDDLERAQEIGAQGIAGISGLWPALKPR
ncbi:8-oxo-dGTP diphosphatase MutT [Halopseudomonas laoshanensis]|uniref:8-oxo-dGTP diphosphatase n=1 Tax=Halopseudomonas laoshanensis TaxID=2268758 RepID=A0A7V7KXR3_9GAMM|nr:8-oxo-dGTP diphosphatase MutT [Halopseudomonas laoshanensis]KAA0694936.1 8-oxo-dGTP diphosphatase MutT [Halopseudomonas laoshanensis]